MKLFFATIALGTCLSASQVFASSVIYSQDFNNLPGGPNSSTPYVDAKDVLPVGNTHGKWDFWSVTRQTIDPNSPIVSPPQGMIQVTSNATNGSAVLILHDKSNSYYSLNEAILTVDLSQYTDVTLKFDEYDSNDEEHSFGASQFTGHKQADGVAVSSDGTNWFRIYQSYDHNGSWVSSGLLNISALIASVNNPTLLSASSQFKIKFQQYDNYEHGTDGRKFDNIVVAGVHTPSGGAVPEPATLAMFSLGLICILFIQRRLNTRVLVNAAGAQGSH